MATPKTQIDILNVPFNFTQQNVFSFDSVAQQANYFKGMIRKSYPACYVVKENVIRVEDSFDKVVGNYLRFNNDGKWYYGFIMEVKYINEYTTEIIYKIDAWQTYYFDFTVNSSFVEREHVRDDTVGRNLVPEPFNYPKYPVSTGSAMRQGDYFAVAVTFTADAFNEPVTDEILAGIIPRVVGRANGRATGGITRLYSLTDAGMHVLKAHIDSLPDKGANSISSMLEVPNNFTSTSGNPVYAGEDVNSITTPFYKTTADSLNSIQDKLGYRVKNFKLMSDQFFHWELTNNAGGILETYPSETAYSAPQYHTNVSLGQDIFAVSRVENLKVGRSTVHLTSAPLNTVSWVGDNYAEYKAANQNSLRERRTQTITNSIMAGGLSLATGNAVGAFNSFVGGYDSVKSQLATEKDIQNSFTGQRGSHNASGLGVIHAQHNVWWAYALNKYDLERADLYLSRYGYQVNSFKIPEHRSRTNFNYIKTAECNLSGPIPAMYMSELVSMYNNGFTLWHGQNFNRSRDNRLDFSHFMNYDVNEIRGD